MSFSSPGERDRNVPRNLSDAKWKRLKSRLPGGLLTRAQRNEASYRDFVEDVLWVVEHNVVWHALRPERGDWHTVYVRFLRWSDKGVWEQVAEILGPHHPLGIALIQRVGEHREFRERSANPMGQASQSRKAGCN